MCGIIGYIGEDQAIHRIYPALMTLQHRGQDSAGVATYGNEFHLKKGNGLVATVFNSKNIERLKGTIGIGHVRYPTVGMGHEEDAQPFIITTPYGIAMAHNGNLVNYFDLKKQLITQELRYFNSNCDVEVILNLLSVELMKLHMQRIKPDMLFKALARVYKRLIGSYAVVAILAGRGLLAFRDPLGIKPLVMGKDRHGHCLASESVALDLLGYTDIIDVAPGQAIFIDMEHNLHRTQIARAPKKKQAACIFEYVYFARPDSIIDTIGVYEARLRLGRELGMQIAQTGLRPDVVIPVPDTARASAQMVAEVLNVKYREGLIKNRYIHRTFIMPNQAMRIESVRLKLNTIRSEIAGKKVLLVDDSIVRGNTSREIIALLKKSGARKVYFASYSPPLHYPCVYGIDMQTRGEFIARNRTLDQIRDDIGADGLFYQTVESLEKAVGQGTHSFCTACFSGRYPTTVPALFLERIEADRRMHTTLS
ncbi:amidophosphoribosyltransferase [candidate division WOR-3 bacterium]|nr:amidophosphoribosyltransferase [candidate division WOR-3 bacterium]